MQYFLVQMVLTISLAKYFCCVGKVFAKSDSIAHQEHANAGA